MKRELENRTLLKFVFYISLPFLFFGILLPRINDWLLEEALIKQQLKPRIAEIEKLKRGDFIIMDDGNVVCVIAPAKPNLFIHLRGKSGHHQQYVQFVARHTIRIVRYGDPQYCETARRFIFE